MKDKLLEQLSSPDTTERRQAAENLAEHKGDEVIAALATALEDPARPVCEAAAESLIAINGPQVCDQVIPLLRSENARVRNYAIEILEKTGDSDLEAITELLKDENHDVRKFAADILGFLVEIGSEDAFLPLVRTLDDENINVAAAAAEALGRLGNAKAIPFLLRQLERGSWMQSNAIGAIAEIGGPAAAEALEGVDRTKLTPESLFCLETALKMLRVENDCGST
jgi:HEAT repeat protein